MGINGKFSIVIAVFLLTIIMIFGAGITGMSQIRRASEQVISEHAMRRILSNRVLALTNEAVIDIRDLMLNEDEALNPPINAKIDQSIKNAQDSFMEIRALENDATRAQIEASIVIFQKWKEANVKVRELAAANKNAEAYKLSLTTAGPERREMTKLLKEIIDISHKEMDAGEAENNEIYTSLRNLMVAVALLGLSLGMALAFIILKSINRAVNETIETLFDTANQVASAAQQVAASSQNLSEAATQQGSSLEETSAAVEEMNSMVGRNAESARESSQVAEQGVRSAEKGQAVVDRMMASMIEINQANQSVMKQTDVSNTQLTEIVALIHEIGSKTKVINEIVFQTKLLSFNASVEAARAGEHGKGFAVVAEEVGNLARMSGSAAKDITELLDGSITKVQGIVSNSKTQIERIVIENTQKVDAGTKIATECRVVLEDISKGILDVSQMAQSIAGASDEQARGINEINKAITQLDQVTQVNAASSEEAASASEELSAQAEQMKLAVNRLMVVIRGSRGEAMGVSERPVPAVRGRSNVLTLRKAPFAQPSMSSSRRVVGGLDVTSDD